MADNIILNNITFNMLDDDGNIVRDNRGYVKVFTLKDKCDCSWICEGTDEDDLKEITQGGKQ